MARSWLAPTSISRAAGLTCAPRKPVWATWSRTHSSGPQGNSIPRVAVALKNSGGIRDHIGLILQPAGTTRAEQVVFSPPTANPDSGKRDGEITRFDIESVLRFNNGLVIVPLTAQQLVGLMEHAIGFDGVGAMPDGRFPQVAGLRFSFDPAKPPGERIQSLAVVADDGEIVDPVMEDGALVGDPNRVIRIAVLNFTANGGDGYPFPQPAFGRVDLAGEAGQYNPSIARVSGHQRQRSD